jgi:phage tail tape-measure protein
MADDNIQHGIDDNPENDAEKAAALGGLGGAVVGAAAGATAGSVVPGGGTLVGAVVGGIGGALASGAAVAGVDQVDNDNNVTGLGDDIALDKDADNNYGTTTGGAFGNDINSTTDTRGIAEKTADAVTGDRIDDKTGNVVR